MLRGLSSSAAVLAVGLLLTGCTNFPGTTSSSSGSTDTGNASCTGSGAAAKVTPSSQGLSGIVAHGTCSVVGVPDTANLLINVETQGPTARAATDAANGRADAVIGALRGKGLAQNDVRAGQLLVNPVISPVLTSPTGVGGTRVTGFVASRLISATVRTIGNAAAITSTVLDTAGDAGRVQLTYSISDDSALRNQARTAAVKLATDKARTMAEAAGVSLGQLVSITEVPPPTISFTPTAPESSATSSAGTSAQQSPQVDTDGQLLEVAVDVVYAVG
jgi:uncharacterized protein YggE